MEEQSTVSARGIRMATPEVSLDIYSKALTLLQEDADKIEKLIEVQMETLTNRRCPLYEEVLDTQMYGLSREIDFAVRVGLISEHLGKEIINRLQRNLDVLYEALNNKQDGVAD
jgi:uncharacterized protein YlaN (UPF0358 family)